MLKEKKKIILVVILIILFSVIAYYFYANTNESEVLNFIQNDEDENSKQELTEDHNGSLIENLDKSKIEDNENEDSNGRKIVDSEGNKIEDSDENSKIIVHIDGCVNNPGIVELKLNDRVCDAIESAGGLTGEADISKINLASFLEDGMKIHIPNVNEKDVDIDYNDTREESNNSTIKKKVNINSATQSELETLPGIGNATATKIIDYRKENGKFKSIDDIKNVKGIGSSKFEKIKNLICVN